MMAVVLRIFSGLHNGAEIELAEGVHVLGTDDSCDIILCDSSLTARHAALRVTADDDGAPLLLLEALDGKAMLDGRLIETSGTVPALHPFFLGLLALAWSDAEDPVPALGWKSVEDKLNHRESVEAMPASEVSSEMSATSPAGSISSEGSALFAGSEQSAETAGEKVDTVQKSTWRGKLAVTAAILLAAGLCFSFQSSDPVIGNGQRMRALLDEAGYKALSVTEKGKTVVVSGRIASDRERGRLLRLAQLLDFPVYLDVAVRSDAANAVKATFNTLGLYPEVTELPPSAHPGLTIRGYIKNGILEQQALSMAARNVPALQCPEDGGRPALDVFRDIRYEQDVRMKLAPALSAAGLNRIDVEYLPGRIALHGRLTPEIKASLERVAREVRRSLGVPVIFDIISVLQEQNSKPANIYAQGEKSAPQKQADWDDGESFRITSVSMGALKFVSLANGERVFEGGELPGGYLLESIDVDALTLSRNNQTTIYPLRDSHE